VAAEFLSSEQTGQVDALVDEFNVQVAANTGAHRTDQLGHGASAHIINFLSWLRFTTVRIRYPPEAGSSGTSSEYD
jgi:hypothetical protein